MVALFMIAVMALSSWAEDTVVLHNGKVIHGAIIHVDSMSIIITPWEQRRALFPHGEAYGKDEIQAITFDGGIPVFGAVAGVKNLSIQKGSWELSLAASFRSVQPDSGASSYFLNIPFRVGYFLTRNVSGELELMISQPKTGDMGYLMTANALIHPQFKLMNPRLWFRGFLLIGFGFGTAMPQGDVVAGTSDEPLNVVQGGIGVKIGSGPIALRVEYRATSMFGKREVYHQGYDNEGQYYAYRDNQSHTDVFHSITVGFSVFLNPR
jgi:hypothetical protein